MQLNTGTEIFIRARAIRRTLGVYIAARYLYLRGVSLATAVDLLATKQK